MKKHVVFKQFVEKLKPHTKLHVVKEYRGDGFRYSVRDFVAGMMGNSSWCYGRFMSADDALSVFPGAKYKEAVKSAKRWEGHMHSDLCSCPSDCTKVGA